MGSSSRNPRILLKVGDTMRDVLCDTTMGLLVVVWVRRNVVVGVGISVGVSDWLEVVASVRECVGLAVVVCRMLEVHVGSAVGVLWLLEVDRGVVRVGTTVVDLVAALDREVV